MIAFMLLLTVTQLRCTVLVKMKAPKAKFFIRWTQRDSNA